LKNVMSQVAGADTAYDPEEYRKNETKSKLVQHCYVVARFIQKHFGGCLMQGRVQGVSHYWNVLPDGTEIDLTSCQFPGGNGFHPLAKGRKAPTPKNENKRVVVFEQRVLAACREAGLQLPDERGK